MNHKLPKNGCLILQSGKLHSIKRRNMEKYVGNDSDFSSCSMFDALGFNLAMFVKLYDSKSKSINRAASVFAGHPIYSACVLFDDYRDIFPKDVVELLEVYVKYKNFFYEYSYKIETSTSLFFENMMKGKDTKLPPKTNWELDLMKKHNIPKKFWPKK